MAMVCYKGVGSLIYNASPPEPDVQDFDMLNIISSVPEFSTCSKLQTSACSVGFWSHSPQRRAMGYSQIPVRVLPDPLSSSLVDVYIAINCIGQLFYSSLPNARKRSTAALP